MSDLEVDYDLLHDSEQTLAYLKSEFDGLKNRTGDLKSALRQHDLESAMDEFSGNMDYNKGKLSEEMQTVGKQFHDTLQAFADADKKLADELKKASESNGNSARGPR